MVGGRVCAFVYARPVLCSVVLLYCPIFFLLIFLVITRTIRVAVDFDVVTRCTSLIDVPLRLLRRVNMIG
jgi:hypothetical protein